MTNTEKDKHYDEVIAPLLLTVMEKCKDADIPFIAAAFISPGNWGETAYIPIECNTAHIRTVQKAVQAAGNADSLIMWMMKHGREHGHNSACLYLLDGDKNRN